MCSELLLDGRRPGIRMLLHITVPDPWGRMHALPIRHGPRPNIRPGLPHAQLDQQPTDRVIPVALAARAFRLPSVIESPSTVSVPGARALVLDAATPAGPPEAFVAGREFAHLHPSPDHSLHLCLPVPVAEAACTAGWAEPHPLVGTGRLPAGVVLVYAARDDAELGVVYSLLETSHRFAVGNELPAIIPPKGEGEPR